MTLNQLIDLVENQPHNIRFEAVLELIDTLYDYSPTTFSNGLGKDRFVNAAGSNEGSCRIFAFAREQGFNQQQTLHCFAQYYRDDVLEHPQGKDHANIRTFMRYGWDGIDFEGSALSPK